MRKIYILISIVLAGFACDRPQSQDNAPENSIPGNPQTAANTITYDVVIKNTSEDGQWAIDCLEGLNRQDLVEHIFEGIYAEKLKAFDIFDGKSISPRKIRKMEEKGEIDRNSIGKLQFVEEWSIDPATYVLSKEIIAINIGVENFGSDGLLRGYNPLFRIQFN